MFRTFFAAPTFVTHLAGFRDPAAAQQEGRRRRGRHRKWKDLGLRHPNPRNPEGQLIH